MKKFAAFLLAGMLLCMIGCSCGKEAEQQSPEPTASTAAATAIPTETPQPEEQTAVCEHRELVPQSGSDAGPSCEMEHKVTYICADCGEVLLTVVIPAADHVYTVKTDPDGHHRVCVRCGAAESVEAHAFRDGVCTVCGYGCEHLETDTVTEPTCTALGFTTHTCSICQSSRTDTFVPAKGHVLRETDRKDATCTEAGTITYTCTVCGDVQQIPIPAAGHLAQIDAGTPATCTQTGLTDGSHCAVCGTVLKVQQELPKLEHSFVNGHCLWCGEPDPDYKLDEDTEDSFELPWIPG